MVTTIGIDSRKAPHTAVAIDQSETVLAEITVRADRFQIPRLLDWAYEVDGLVVAWVWAVEAVAGLGYLLNRRLVARGEPVADVPTVLASLVRVLGSWQV